jgi:hypothetical protein
MKRLRSQGVSLLRQIALQYSIAITIHPAGYVAPVHPNDEQLNADDDSKSMVVSTSSDGSTRQVGTKKLAKRPGWCCIYFAYATF